VTDLRHLFRREPKAPSAPADARARDVPADLWVRCDQCHELVYARDFERALKVCPRCGHHARVGARERIAQLADEDSFREEDGELQPADPLGFESLGQRYRDKLDETQRKTGLVEAALAGTARLEGAPVRLAALDFGFLAASMGAVVGEKVARAAEHSAADRRTLIVVSASGGARMHEGIFSLMQMAKTAAALARLDEARVPFFSVLTDPTTGGVTASFAGLGDVLIAEPGALIGFAGPRVIEQITKQKLPPDAQRAEFLLEHGMLDLVVHRRDLKRTLARLIAAYSQVPLAVEHGV
jgi:acetyl-CoA carboxylase carboxyl transferase subunit beta